MARLGVEVSSGSGHCVIRDRDVADLNTGYGLFSLEHGQPESNDYSPASYFLA